MTLTDLSDRLAVDPKTVERWITVDGRIPYPKHRHRISALLRESESYLWPGALPRVRRVEVAQSEVVERWPHRADAPHEVWVRMLEEASEQIGVLVYAGLFMPEQNPTLIKKLRTKSRAGVRVRLLLGDPECPQVFERGREEGIEDAIPSKIRNVLAMYQTLQDVDRIELRLHRTTLYNSIYRFDDEMLVNTHVYGFVAAHAPLIHLRRLSEGDLFEMYSESFEKVWTHAKPAWNRVEGE